MSHPSPKTLLLIGSVAVALALVLGLAGTVGRANARARSAPADRAPDREPAAPTLHTPEVLPSLEGKVPVPSTSEVQPAAPVPSEARASDRRLVGLVLRPDGEPAARARVALGKQHGRCDAEGRFELALAAAVAEADLIAFEPGFEPALRPAFRANPEGESHVRLVLGPESLTLSGTVVGEDGEPQKNWTVELDGPDPLATFGLRESVRTSDDGRFVLTDVPAGTHVVRAWKKKVEAAVRSIPADAGTTDLAIVVRPGA
jgi:hypothetical protein